MFKKDTIVSIYLFFSGSIPSTIVSYQLFDNIVVPMVLATLTGLVGGIAALLGKDIYVWIKKKILK